MSNDIDWSKPVKYVRHGVTADVLHTFVLNDVRYVVMRRHDLGIAHPHELVVREADDLTGTFRNVRRKVKREAWLNLYPNRLQDHDTREAADRLAASDRLECRHIEWEADADD